MGATHREENKVNGGTGSGTNTGTDAIEAMEAMEAICQQILLLSAVQNDDCTPDLI